MESSDVIAFQDAIIRTSSLAHADVRVTKTPFDDVNGRFFRSSRHLSADEENLLFVEAVPIAASELKNGEIYHVESCPSSPDVREESTRSGSGIKVPDECTDKGKEPDVGEQRFGSDRLVYDGEEKKVVPHEEAGDVQASLIESMERLALSTGDQPPSRKTDSEESNQRDEKTHEIKEQENSLTEADVRGRGPTGGVAVAYPPNAPNYGWAEQSYPGAKRPQFAVPQFANFGNDIFIDATLRNSFSAGDDCAFQPTKFRRGPQPVESEDLSPLDDACLPLTWLSPKDIAEVLGGDDCVAIIDEFFPSGNFYNIPEPSNQKVKYEYPPNAQFLNGSVIGELFPSRISSSFLQHLHQDQHQQQPSHATNPIPAGSPLAQVPTLAVNPPGEFLQLGRALDRTQFCDDALNRGGCTGFQAGELSPPESGFGGSDYSQSPHPSMKGSPGREEDFSLESHENLSEIEAILNFIENDVQPPDGKQPTNAPSTKRRFPLEHPPPGQHPPNLVSSSYQVPPANPQPGKQPTNPPSTNYHFQLENPPVSQPVGQFHHPPYSTAASFHPVQSSPIQRTSVSSFVSNTSPAIPAGPNVRQPVNQKPREETPAEPRRVNGTNSDVAEKNLKDQSLAERKQLAKASSVIARLTRQQLIMPDSDQDTLLHLAIAKNERYLTEALISRLDRDKLTDSMINLKNKQGQTPLCLATVTNQWALVRLLVDRGADVNVRIPLGAKQTKSFCSPLHFAAGNGKEWLRTLEQLLRAKAIDLSALDSEGCSALHKAVMANGLSLFYGRSCEMIDSRESVRQLIIHGIDISQQDGVQSKTALNIAVERGDFDLFYYILDLASPRVSLPLLLNARTGRRGDTLLHVAATLQQIDPSHQLTLVRQMISRGANPQLRNWDNRLPWEMATRPQIAQVLQIPIGVGL